MIVSLCDFIFQENFKGFHIGYLANGDFDTALFRITFSTSEDHYTIGLDFLFISAFVQLYQQLTKKDK